MLQLFCPDYRCKQLDQISIDWLITKQIKVIILDLDNTLMTRSSLAPSETIQQWVFAVQKAGIRIIVLSNNGGKRMRNVQNLFGVPTISWAVKPLSFGFKRALQCLEVKNTDGVLVIGDQLLTDVWGAKRLGLKVLWIESRSGQEFIFTKLTRTIESFVIKRLNEKNLMPRRMNNEDFFTPNDHCGKR
ncbi:MAG TPA: YqeG family HAD IIIA-type phosphatase [Candidatus Avacidaminococcus intestinavium]|uniref:YqeG family HAD IIIA-type phosphatase n=1 Tax=Candidatus Avacidaminococcus intestinavium TaxID=2840684 RepID=A0A9D1MQ41_9FIRM|nr:YqeG family HAD IIIA-type phosphatase [Candidatus Avacidaminococcus intestinavium]